MSILGRFGIGGKRVLLAEDDAYLRPLLARELRAKGYEVLEARDGSEAVLLLRRHVRDLDGVVADLLMPGLGGDELLRQVKVLRPELPVLLISAFPEEAQRLSGRGWDVPCLLKPFEAKDFVSRLADVLRG